MAAPTAHLALVTVVHARVIFVLHELKGVVHLVCDVRVTAYGERRNTESSALSIRYVSRIVCHQWSKNRRKLHEQRYKCHDRANNGDGDVVCLEL